MKLLWHAPAKPAAQQLSIPISSVHLSTLLVSAVAAISAVVGGLLAECANAAAPLTQGTPRVEAFLATANGDEGELRAVQAGIELVAAPRLRVAVTPQAGLAVGQNTDGESVLIGSLDMQWRWYALQLGALSTFIEAGAGLQYTGSRSFPAAGTHFNFRLRAGLGTRWQATPRFAVLGGYNWLHMSNGNVLDPNVGHDGPMYFLGTSFALGATPTP